MAGLHPVPRRVRAVHAREPVADDTRRDRRPDPRRRRLARLLPRRPRRRLERCCRARVLRLLPQPVQPAADLDPRRRARCGARPAGSGSAAAARRRSSRACSTAAPPRCSRSARSRPTCRRPGSDGRPHAPRLPRASDRRGDRPDPTTSSSRASRSCRRSTVPAVSIFGSARVAEDDPAYVAARAIAREFASHGWAVITGGGPGVMEAANRGAQEGGGLSVGPRHRAPARAGDQPVRRSLVHLRALLRPQGLLREAGRGLRRPPRRLRDARRAVRGADADPDGKGRDVPARPLRLGLLGGDRRLAPGLGSRRRG